MTEAQVEELLALIASVATKENVDGLMEKYDINEDSIAAALDALGNL